MMPSPSRDDRSSFWNFSLALYARPGVADACLQLQDEHGANVNLLLWCVWLAQRGLTLDKTRLQHAQQRIQAWDAHYVIPLRQLRRRMKAEFGSADANIEQLRNQIKQAELLAEKQLQVWLEAEVDSWCEVAAANTSPLATGDNLRLYLSQLNVSEAMTVRLLALLECTA